MGCRWLRTAGAWRHGGQGAVAVSAGLSHTAIVLENAGCRGETDGTRATRECRMRHCFPANETLMVREYPPLVRIFAAFTLSVRLRIHPSPRTPANSIHYTTRKHKLHPPLPPGLQPAAPDAETVHVAQNSTCNASARGSDANRNNADREANALPPGPDATTNARARGLNSTVARGHP